MKGLIFTYVLTYGGAAAALFQPYYGFLVYVCFGVLRPTFIWFHSVPEGNYSRTVAIAMIVGWVLNGMGNWQFGRAKTLVWCLAGFLLVTLLSATQASNQAMAWKYLELLAKILLPLIIGVTMMDSIDRIKQLVWVIVLSQGFLAFEMNMHYLSGTNRFYYNGFGGLDNNGVALTMVTGVGMAFFLMVHEKQWVRKGIVAFLLLLMAHAIMISFSRGGMLALIMCGAVAFVMLPKRPAYITGFAICILIGLRLAGPAVVDRFATVFAEKEERDASAQSRLHLWEACISEMVANPLIGVGPEHFRTVAHLHGLEHGKAAHSTWMQIGAEMGVTGLILIVSFFGILSWRLWRIIRSTDADDDSELPALARMVLCSLTGYIVAAQFVSVSLVEVPYYVAAVGIGVLKLASHPDWCSEDSGYIPVQQVEIHPQQLYA